MQDSLPADWLVFAGRDLNPLGRDERFPSYYISFPFPGFILTLPLHDPGLYGAFLVKGVPQGSYPFSCTSVSWFDRASRFFVPTHTIEGPARAEAVKDGARLRATEGFVLRRLRARRHT